MRILIAFALATAACYGPNPQDGAFQCAESEGFVCPSGLTCDKASGLCVSKLHDDMGIGDALPNLDSAIGPRSCDDRVQQGAFSALVNLGAINSAGDERSVSVSADGTQLYWQDGTGAIQTATLGGDHKSAGAAQAVALGGFSGTVNGGSIAADNTFWFSGTSGTTGLVQAGGRTDAHTFTTFTPHQPSSTCPFADPVFTKGSASNELYITSPLVAGCPADPAQAFIAQGKIDKQLGAFYGAFPGKGYRSPSVSPSGLTMIVSSTSGQLFYASRGDTNIEWSAPVPLPMGAIGASEDRQAVVSPACDVLFLVSKRTGGKGGADLWAATIAAE